MTYIKIGVIRGNEMYTEVEKVILKNTINKMIDQDEDFAMVGTAEVIGDILKNPSICRRTWSVTIRKVIDYE